MHRTLERMTTLLGHAAVACVAAMMLLIIADVVLRSAVGRPIHGVFELVELLLAGAFFLALPASFLRDEHIAVDVVDTWAPRALPMLGRVARALSVVMLAVMIWQATRAARDTWAFGDVTMDLSLPRILYWVPLLCGCAGALLATALGRRGTRGP